MEESIALFDQAINLKCFEKTNVILLLNKNDLFREKLKKNPITKDTSRLFTEYECPTEVIDEDSFEIYYQSVVDHILKLFLVRKRGDKEIYHHVTCFTDMQLTGKIFSACKDIILRKNLVATGFMG